MAALPLLAAPQGQLRGAFTAVLANVSVPLPMRTVGDFVRRAHVIERGWRMSRSGEYSHSASMPKSVQASVVTNVYSAADSSLRYRSGSNGEVADVKRRLGGHGHGSITLPRPMPARVLPLHGVVHVLPNIPAARNVGRRRGRRWSWCRIRRGRGIEHPSPRPAASRWRDGRRKGAGRD